MHAIRNLETISDKKLSDMNAKESEYFQKPFHKNNVINDVGTINLNVLCRKMRKV